MTSDDKIHGTTIPGQDANRTAHEVLRFLWAKWAHCDQLLYTRFNLFWQLQAALFAVVAVVLRPDSKMTLVSVILVGVLGGIIFFIAKGLLEMAEIDRLNRNRFNPEIVNALESVGLLEPGVVSVADWTADNWEHPANNWHAPSGYDQRRTLASKRVQGIGRVLLVVDVVVPILLIVLYLHTSR